MSDYTKEFLEAVEAERDHQINRFGDDVAAGKDGVFFLALLLREFGTLGNTYITSDVVDFENRLTREAQVAVREELKTRFIKMAAVIAAAYEAAERDIAHYANPAVDVIFANDGSE